MGRPADLPKPVRNHGAHENLQDKWRDKAAPGPGRYSGSGLTEFERDRRLGTIPKAARFRDGELAPGDSFSAAERASFLEHAGHKYTPKFNDTKIAVSFSTTSHLSRDRQADTPGPGAYATPLPWDKGVAIPASTRRTTATDCAPGPGAYSPTKPPLRSRAAFIGKHSSIDAAAGAGRHEDHPQLTSLEAMDRGLLATRSSTPSISFAAAGRGTAGSSSSAAGGDATGPGAYNTAGAESVVRPKVKGGSWGKATRANSAGERAFGRLSSGGGRLVALPPPETTSNHASAPAISFTKADSKRGIPVGSGDAEGVPTAKYTPQFTAVDPAPKGVTSWGTPSKSSDRTRQKPAETSNVDFIGAPSTLGGPQVAFAESKRPGLHRSDAAATPGPGAYSPGIMSRKEKREIAFTKAKRDANTGRPPDEGTPGCIYNPDYTVTRPPVGAAVTIARSTRKLKIAEQSSGPDCSYTPSYDAVDRGGRSAILYLTG